MRRLLPPLLPLLLLALPSLAATTPLPPYAAFPSNFVSDPGRQSFETFGREEFPMPGDALPKAVEGKHWMAQLGTEPPMELEGEPTWDRLQAYFIGRGWKVVRSEAGSKVLRYRAA